MSKVVLLECKTKTNQHTAQKIIKALKNNYWIQLVPNQNFQPTIPIHLSPKGPGFILLSSGTTAAPHICLHHCSNLDQSALETGKWLQEQDINPKNCIYINPLPLNHISGLMAWWRSLYWESIHLWISPDLMKDPNNLEKHCQKFFKDHSYKFLASLVPTQLKRLLDSPTGEKWLKSLDLIWVGGAPLSEGIAAKAREKGIRLAPCYGATETTAMIASQTPDKFLQGSGSVGPTFKGIDCKVDSNGILHIHTKRIATAYLKNNKLEKLTDEQGWWKSNDIAEINDSNGILELNILGRSDKAIITGGEKIYPDKIQNEIMNIIEDNKLPICKIIITSREDIEWGERLIAIVNFPKEVNIKHAKKIILELKTLIKKSPPESQPKDWYYIETLSFNNSNKKIKIPDWEELIKII